MPAKYQLDTIPVWDALGRDTECLLCDLEAEGERRNTEFFLGPSVMAPQMRVQLNRRGFRPRHLHMLGSGTGKLGYALALGLKFRRLSDPEPEKVAGATGHRPGGKSSGPPGG